MTKKQQQTEMNFIDKQFAWKEEFLFNVLTEDNPYDEDREKNSIDGFGDEAGYKAHYLDEANNLLLEDFLPKV